MSDDSLAPETSESTTSTSDVVGGLPKSESRRLVEADMRVINEECRKMNWSAGALRVFGACLLFLATLLLITGGVAFYYAGDLALGLTNDGLNDRAMAQKIANYLMSAEHSAKAKPPDLVREYFFLTQLMSFTQSTDVQLAIARGRSPKTTRIVGVLYILRSTLELDLSSLDDKFDESGKVKPLSQGEQEKLNKFTSDAMVAKYDKLIQR